MEFRVSLKGQQINLVANKRCVTVTDLMHILSVVNQVVRTLRK